MFEAGWLNYSMSMSTSDSFVSLLMAIINDPLVSVDHPASPIGG